MTRFSRALTLTLLAIGLLSGCATMAAYRAEQARWQALADQVTAAAHVPPIPIRPVDGLNGRYLCRENMIALGTDATPFLLGHELGHYVLGHGCGVSLANEKAANAFAIRALETWGYTEQGAVDTALRILVSARQRRLVIPGHDWCAEIQDIVQQYPQSTTTEVC